MKWFTIAIFIHSTALFASANTAPEAFDAVDFVLNNSYARENPFAEYDICIEKARNP
jgi:hypothetical protein